MSYADVNGLRMYYEEHGTGTPLVLLHGGLLTIELCFGELLPELATRHRVIAVELQGHGRTADIDRDFALSSLAGDVVALLDHLGIARAAVFGFSIGGLVALELAVHHGDRIDRAVLASAHYRADGYYPEITDPAQQGVSDRLPTGEHFGQMTAAYRAVAPDPEHFGAFADRCGGMMREFTGWRAAQLRAIAVPVFLVLGDHDFVRPEHAAEMHALIPDSRLAMLPACTHMDVTHRPAQLLPMLSPFLA